MKNSISKKLSPAIIESARAWIEQDLLRVKWLVKHGYAEAAGKAARNSASVAFILIER